MHPQSTNDLGKIIQADFRIGTPRPKTTGMVSTENIAQLTHQDLFVCRCGKVTTLRI